jgi:hypothetical protein
VSDAQLPFYLARRIPSIPVIARYSSSVRDESRRDQGESPAANDRGVTWQQNSSPNSSSQKNYK